jgi:hypothetical protein
MNSIKTHTLSNGITIVHRQVVHTEISHLGIMLDIGSRDENEQTQGLAHFWEHMAFKGTHKKNNLQIINRLEDLFSCFNFKPVLRKSIGITNRHHLSFYFSRKGIRKRKKCDFGRDGNVL